MLVMIFFDDYLPYFVNIHKHRLELPYSGKVLRTNAKLNIKSFGERFDAVVCLATAHQLNFDQKIHIWEECYRVLKPGGELVIQDIARGSKTERFLNNFVSIHKAEGYSCFSLSKLDMAALDGVGFVTKDKSPIDVSWWASSEEALTQFCMQLFEFDGILDFETLRDSLKHFLGIKPWIAGVKMAWPMQRIVLRKRG